VPALKGGPLADRALFWHYPHYGNQGGAPSAAIRRGDHKLIEWFEEDKVELFNVVTDPGETKNLAAEQPELAAKLRSELHAWQKEVGAKATLPNPAYDPAKPNGRAAERKPQGSAGKGKK
jgi:arylsulfatase A-like enzyme